MKKLTNQKKTLLYCKMACVFLFLVLTVSSDIHNFSNHVTIPDGYQQGLEAKRDGQYPGAKTYFQKSIQLSVNFLPAYVELISLASDSMTLCIVDSLFTMLNQKNPDNPGPIFGLALICIKKWQLDRAIGFLNRCHPALFYKNLVSLKFAEAERYLGYFKESNKQLKKILESYRIVAEPQIKAQALDLMGENCYDLGDLKRAEALHQMALEIAIRIGDGRRHASALINLARLYYRFENYSKAETHLLSAIAQAHATNDSLILADALRNLGVIHWLRGYFQKAMIEGYAPALKIYRSYHHRYGEAITLSDIGLLYYQRQDFYPHFQYQEQALAIQMEIGDRRGQSDTYYFIGNAWYQIGAGSKALKLLNHAYRIAKEIDYYWIQEAVSRHDYKPLGKSSADDFEQQSIEIMGLSGISELRVKAWLACQNSRYNESLAIMRYLLPLEQKQYNLKNVANCHLVMGECFLNLDKLDSSWTHFEIGKVIHDSIGLGNFNFNYGLGTIAEKKGKWSKALTYYGEAIQSHKKKLANTESLEFQATWSGRIAESHHAIIRMLVRLGQENSNQTSYYSQAFKHWQKATADQFNQLMVGHFDRKSPQNSYPIKLIQKHLSAKTCLLGYLVDERQTFIFVLSAQCFDVLEVPIARTALENKLQFTRSLLEQVNYTNDVITQPSWREVLKSLYEVLILPVQDAGYFNQIEHLLIVPNRALNYLPFACLIGSDSSGKIPATETSAFLPAEEFFLVQKYTIAYLASAEMTKFLIKPESIHFTYGKRPWLVITPFPDQFQGTSREMYAIASDSNRSIHFLAGSLAHERVLKQKMPFYDLIHFATHSYLAIELPESTYIELQSSNIEDGRLTVPEILKLNLNTDLIVLSSCETGLGASHFYNPVDVNNYHPLDDFIGLNRAFLIAGAKKVLSTFWSVQDAASAEFMDQYYHHLASFPPDIALAKTQRHFISLQSSKNNPLSTLLAHPYVWGAYMVVVGRP